MFYVYLLQSKLDRKLYIGYTADLKRRVAEHQAGQSFSTSFRRPFELVYYEAYKARGDAEHREKMLKLFGRSLGGLKRRLNLSFRP